MERNIEGYTNYHITNDGRSTKGRVREKRRVISSIQVN